MELSERITSINAIPWEIFIRFTLNYVGIVQPDLLAAISLVQAI